MKTVAIFFAFICLTLFAVKGHPGVGRQRCICQGPGVKMVKPKLIETVVIHRASAFCNRLEIVVTLRNGAGSRCLNQYSSFTKSIIDRLTKDTRRTKM
ncbi:C-X-C motif chemokine 11-1-like [Paramisgurnus dabryanus]|uniref:C-X-C motif chemokine 11-1-like n=1 Tax=Paramisgurnus dabryanus TaxID=90735 RepID=UPI003CCF082E